MTHITQESNWWTSPFMVTGSGSIFLLLLPWVRDLFINSGQRWLYIFSLAFLVTFTLTPLVRRLGIKFRVIDVPDIRRIHLVPTPRVGGIGVFLGFSLSVLGNWIIPSEMAIILLAGILLMLVGIADDTWGLPAWFKLLAQLTASGLVISWGMVLTLFPSGPLGDIANILLTVFWLVGITNAFNFVDGMDGLAGGLAVLIAFFLGVRNGPKFLDSKINEISAVH
ncbi:MAG: undecaprenyl/decaprenyl-phosphate alpha-N-acetylglucosaminyl 1-phosphate transferase [Nitrospinae bacterium]|nr:undecaprenyl/decaprenyl-phosphate alpha-N-acetylglucosaminyl 1-phosphate transferase [Nitrospinota bacterium]